MQEKTNWQVNNDTILHDLVRRARGGIVIYPVVWCITALWGGVYDTTPLFFYLQSVIFAVLLVCRLVLDRLVIRRVFQKSRVVLNIAVSFILLSCFHWGLISSWIIYLGDYPELHYMYIVILAAFATGGTVTLSISKPIRVLYPVLMFGPSVLAAIYVGGEENYIFAVLAILTVGYIWDSSGVSAHDYWQAVHQQRLAEKRAVKLRELSITDPLTKLGNRAFWDHEFALAWKRCGRMQVPISLLILDLDHFKSINDNYGHGCGDQCLELIGYTLKNELMRETDIIARYGGEEFAIGLPGTSLDGAKSVAERVVKKVALLDFTYEKNRIPIRCSIGVATTHDDFHISSPKALIESADRALYRAKEEGRNRYCVEDEIPAFRESGN